MTSGTQWTGAELRVARVAVLFTVLAAALFLAGSYLAPLLDSAGLKGGDLLRGIYAPVCHQSPQRCFEVGQGVQAVCTRCSGLYWGGLIGLLAVALIVSRRLRPRPSWLLAALAPTVVDALLPWVGLPQLGPLARHLLAWPAGFMVGLILASGIAELAISLRSKRARGPAGLRTGSLLEGSDG